MFSNSELSPQSKHENINIFKIIYEIKMRIITVENFDNMCNCYLFSLSTLLCVLGVVAFYTELFI